MDGAGNCEARRSAAASEDINNLDGLQMQLSDNSVLSIVLAVAGGAG
jgi:hypothetical protein